jgi:hypothetical protein
MKHVDRIARRGGPCDLYPEIEKYSLGCVRRTRLPKQKLLYEPLLNIKPTYQPAPLNGVSLVNGFLKWKHPQRASITTMERLEIMGWLEDYLGFYLNTKLWNEDEILECIDPTKACGPPYCFVHGPTKGHVLEQVTIGELMEDFDQFSQLSLATLKMETRKIGKDARLFIPANIAMVVMGNHLFGSQNQSIIDYHNDLCIKIGLSSPGFEAYKLWWDFSRKIGEFHQFDGAQNDAHMSLEVLSIIRDLRKLYIPEEEHDRVDRYYNMTHCGYTMVGGHLVEMNGQPSGQTNTAHDNSLAVLILLMLNAIRNGIDYVRFRELLNDVVIMGDDLMLCDSTGVFDPVHLEQTWDSCGMYLECPALHEHYEDMTFIGMHPTRERGELLYSYNLEKMMNNFEYRRRNHTPQIHLQKLVNLCYLVFAHRTEFEMMREAAYQYYRDNEMHMTDDDRRLLMILQDLTQLNRYKGLIEC